ncbi:MAG: CDP-alcohol phosphatidyltransferase family protein [Spirochaetes bacterium]|nr:CDP-alcohol phosphatidyltransferase family protein [Spirochaetota bacterium]
MSLANIFTASRIVLSPVFLLFFFLPEYIGINALVYVIILWLLFIYMELSDLFDGMAARATNSVSDFGKIFDPFGDVVSRMTYFLCFTVMGIMHVFVFAILMYREFIILFMRILAMRKGFAMGARLGGKLKAWAYAFAGIFGLIYVSVIKTGYFLAYSEQILFIAQIFFVLSAVAALLSLTDYLLSLKKNVFNK